MRKGNTLEAWRMSPEDTLKALQVDQNKGQSNEEVIERRKYYGYNSIPNEEKTSFLMQQLKQFQDNLVLMQLGSACISFIQAIFEDSDKQLASFVEPFVILTILILNATVGILQESNAEKAIEKLKENSANEAIVIREYRTLSIKSEEQVPGDIVILSDGDKVPADIRICNISSSIFQVDEAMLTGESEAVIKTVNTIDDIKKIKNIQNVEKITLAFSGTLVVRGRCIGVVISTGMYTEFGKIANDQILHDDINKTPQQIKLDELSDYLSKCIVYICILVWLINLKHFFDPIHITWYNGAVYYFKIAISLAVAAIPEGLPAVVTTCLALGTRRMAKRGAIMRSQPSVETLGCTTIICSDKTGTLTTNKMSVQVIGTINVDINKNYIVDTFIVDGDSWSPYGEIYKDDKKYGMNMLIRPSIDVPALSKISCISVLCNESTIYVDTTTTTTVTTNDDDDNKNIYKKTGAPTEAALLVLAEKIGVPDEIYYTKQPTLNPSERIQSTYKYWRHKYFIESINEFTRERKIMSTQVRDILNNNKRIQQLKGAPEIQLERSTYVLINNDIHKITKELLNILYSYLNTQGSKGQRCIGQAYKQYEYNDTNESIEENQQIFVGIVGMSDPIRQGVKQSLNKAKKAGIRVAVITGDNPITAQSVCKSQGQLDTIDDINIKNYVYTGQEQDMQDEESQKRAILIGKLFCRVEPRHKQLIVDTQKRNGEIVAMTGDGVNDATALRKADIGIAMGSGTSVAKEASEMIQKDDNFATIVDAIQEGRVIFTNTKQFIRYQVSSNIGEVACIFLTTLQGLRDIQIPVQQLWVNLVTDGLPATAQSFNPTVFDTMERPPRNTKEPQIDTFTIFRYICIGGYVGQSTVMGYIYWYLWYPYGPNITWKEQREQDLDTVSGNTSTIASAIPNTISLSILVTVEMFNAYNAISENQSQLKITIFDNIWVLQSSQQSFIIHLCILYIPIQSKIFQTTSLGINEWIQVIVLSLPIIQIDEILKYISRDKEQYILVLNYINTYILYPLKIMKTYIYDIKEHIQMLLYRQFRHFNYQNRDKGWQKKNNKQ